MKNIIWTLSIILIGATDTSAQKTFQTVVTDAYCVDSEVNMDGSYMQCSGALQNGAYDFELIKLDSFGSPEWSKLYGGSLHESANAMALATDGGCLLAGSTDSFGAGSRDFYLVRVDSIGGLVWSKAIGGPEWESVNSVTSTIDGGFVIAGYTQSFGPGDKDIYIVKVNSDRFIWHHKSNRVIFNIGFKYTFESKALKKDEDPMAG